MKQTSSTSSASSAAVPPTLLSCVGIARTLGCSKSTLSRAVRGPIQSAVAPCGRVNILDPSFSAWLETRGQSLDLFETRARLPERPKPDPAKPEPAEPFQFDPTLRDLDADEVTAMTFGDVIDLFGSDERYCKWAKGRKEMAIMRRNERAADRAAGKLVPKALLHEIGGVFQKTTQLLLEGAAKTIASRLILGSLSIEDGVEIAKAQMSPILALAKREVMAICDSDDGASPIPDVPNPPPRDPRLDATQAVSIAERKISQSIAERVADQFQPSKVNADRDFDSIVRSVLCILDQEFARAKREIYHGDTPNADS